MAKVNSPFPFLGTLGEVSVYKNRLTDKLIARMKGGGTKEKILTAPSCQGIREQNEEFKMCGQANRALFKAVHYTKHLTDFVMAGGFTTLIKAVQCEDPVHQKGERSIVFSENRQFLEGFHITRQNSIDSVLSNPITATLNRSDSKATVQLPDVVPGVNFRHTWPYTIFRFIVCLGAIDDILFKDELKRYSDTSERWHSSVNGFTTEWMTSDIKNPGRTIDIGLKNNTPLTDTASMIVSVGIEFGNTKFNGIQPVKHVGCAKIVAVG